MNVINCSRFCVRIIALLCSCILSLSIYAHDFVVDGLCYNVIDYSSSTCCVTKKTPSYHGDIIIPSIVNHGGKKYIVTEIGNEAFSFSNLVSVNIPESIVKIGKYAFWGTVIDSLSIPGSVSVIGDSCFVGCQLKTLVICDDSSDLQLGSGAFNDVSVDKLFWGRNTDYYKRDFFAISGFSFPLIFRKVHSLEIGNNVTSIEMNLYNIKEFKAGRQLKYLPSDLWNVEELQMLSLYEPIGSGSFSQKIYSTTILKIPYDKAKDFKNHPTWGLFLNIVEDEQLNELQRSEENNFVEDKVGKKREKVYDVVEQMPQFPGGPSALFTYLAENVNYPVVAEENGVQGRVIISFVVELDGTITDVKVVKSVDPSLDKEAQRVVMSMPHWIPGRQNDEPVRVKYTVPVTFRL